MNSNRLVSKMRLHLKGVVSDSDFSLADLKDKNPKKYLWQKTYEDELRKSLSLEAKKYVPLLHEDMSREDLLVEMKKVGDYSNEFISELISAAEKLPADARLSSQELQQLQAANKKAKDLAHKAVLGSVKEGAPEDSTPGKDVNPKVKSKLESLLKELTDPVDIRYAFQVFKQLMDKYGSTSSGPELEPDFLKTMKKYLD